MTRPPLSDETLMAYADGELDADGVATVEAAIQADPEIADRVALFDLSRQKLTDGLGEAESVPAALLASVKAMAAKHEAENQHDRPSEPSVIAFPARAEPPQATPRATQRVTPGWQLPLAASIALLAGLAVGPFLPWSGDDTTSQIAMTGLDTPGLTAALTSVASGQRIVLEDGSELEAIASFEDGAGTLCREFELDQPSGQTLVSVACHQNEAWSLRFAVAAGQNNDGYAPASSLEALDGYLTAIEAGEPLGLEAEADALSAL